MTWKEYIDKNYQLLSIDYREDIDPDDDRYDYEVKYTWIAWDHPEIYKQWQDAELKRLHDLMEAANNKLKKLVPRGTI